MSNQSTRLSNFPEAVSGKEGLTFSKLTVLMLIPIYLGRFQELWPVLRGAHIAQLATGVAFLLLLFSPINISEESRLMASFKQVRYILWMILLGFASVPFSVWKGGSFNFMIDFLKNTVFVFLIIICASEEADRKRISWTLILTILVLMIFAAVSPRLVEDGRISVTGTYDTNDFALLIIMSFPLTYALMQLQRTFLKVFLAGVLLLMVITVLKTGSRGGFLSLLFVIGIILYRRGAKFVFAMVPLAVIFAVLISLTVSDSSWRRLATTFHPADDYNVTAKEGRIEVWKRGITIMCENPVLGSGPGTFTVAEGLAHEGGKWSAAHNSFVQIGAELGVSGLALFILILYSSLASVRQRDGTSRWFEQGVEVGLYAFCVGGFFLSWAYSYAFYFFIALSIVSVKTRQLAGPAESAAR